MKLERIPHNPGELLEFYEAGLASLGALCERTWHDRLEVVAEGAVAKLWNPDGALHEVELQFAAADTASARDAGREVFPGCPLTFQLAGALRQSPLPLERFVLPDATPQRPPDAAVMEKLWRAQFPDTSRWQLTGPPRAGFHFSLVVLARCEIQAMDQNWSLHRVAVSLTDGHPYDTLARDIGFHETTAESTAAIDWPAPDLTRWCELLKLTLELELARELGQIRVRQENSLRRELERMDDYFEGYRRELLARAKRSSSETSKMKMEERLAAARAEQSRRRADQLARHEICVRPHLDALLLVAEIAWRARLKVGKSHESGELEALFIPRAREWRVEKHDPTG